MRHRRIHRRRLVVEPLPTGFGAPGQAPMSRWTESRAANAAMGALILALLIIGCLTAGDFGLSWDEPDNAAFGRQALAAYASARPPAEWQSNLESKGPFFVAVAEALSKGISVIRNGPQVEARHFAYFLTLPLAAVALYSLSRRMVRPWAGFAAVLLFLTQPLIFGHAFINPKDTPFMAFFLLSMAIGAWMVEAIDTSAPAHADPRRRIVLPLAAGVSLGLTTSIRLFAPFAGLLISILAIGRLKRRAVGPLGLYWVAAGVATFLTWPYLWGNPWGRFWESLRVLVAFPWDNLVLYRGLVYPAKELPWHYLPFTTVIQLTEPALLLAIAGGVLGLVAMIRDPGRRLFYSMLLLWTAVPYGLVCPDAFRVYDNSRQFLSALLHSSWRRALAFEASSPGFSARSSGQRSLPWPSCRA
jgi:hypothetical protein